MNDNMPPEPVPAPDQPKKSNTGLIVAIVLIVLCCLCIGGIVLAWNFGDQVLKLLGVG